MLRSSSKQQQQQQQSGRRPLLLQPSTNHYYNGDDDTAVTRDGAQTKMTTSSQSFEQPPARATARKVVPQQPPKRRLRLFGALGGGGGNSNHHNNNNNHHHHHYQANHTTLPPLTIRTTSRTAAAAATTTTAPDDDSPTTASSIPRTKYDTRPIYTEPYTTTTTTTSSSEEEHDDDDDTNDDGKQQQQQQQDRYQVEVTSTSVVHEQSAISHVAMHHAYQNHPHDGRQPSNTNATTTTTSTSTTIIPTLPRNEKDSKTQRQRRHGTNTTVTTATATATTGKADPPSRQEMEAAELEAQLTRQTTTAAAAQTPQKTAPRKLPPPPPPQQQQQQQAKRSRSLVGRIRDAASQSKATIQQQQQQHVKTATRTNHRQHTTLPRPKSVLHNNNNNKHQSLSMSSHLPRRGDDGDDDANNLHHIVEEKKTDETERLVAKVILQQQQQQQVRKGVGLPQQQEQQQDPARSLLSRPFGRATLPVHVGRKFVVEVSSAEWDADEEKWKYRILVQQRPQKGNMHDNNNNNKQQQQAGGGKGRGSFTTAYTWRSLADFGWLEQALKWEFHGALLVPLLNMAVGVAAVSPTTAVPVESECLRHWLTDLLNGVRGQGEWLYLESCAARHDATTILQSEAMEMFLYRTGPLTDEQLLAFTMFPGGSRNRSDKANNFVSRLARSLEQLGPLAELCVGPMPQSNTAAVEYRYHRPPGTSRRPPRGGVLCTSGALATAPSLDMNDSFGAESFRHARQEHPIVLMRALLHNYRETALQALEKSSSLRPAEEALGVAWKRMAIALTNLFAYEKDVESAKLGDLKVKRENVPFRKVQKSHVDDGLRVLSRQKMERCEPALASVKDFLAALLADLSAVGPAVDAFREAQAHMQQQQRMSGGASTAGGSTLDETASRSRATSSYRRRADWLPKTQSLLSIQRSDTSETQVNMFEERYLRNESALEEALVSLLRHLPARMARIAWRYWQTEISQVAEIHKAAASLRTKVTVIKEESVARMLKRHMEEEKQDKMTELSLIQRMLQIGHKEDSIEESPEVTRKREFALKIAKERLGRWDIKLGLAVMEAIGIQDPNIRVEETTRDLRLVRKYAIGLRECLNRCVEAVGCVRAALLASEGPCRDLREARHLFFTVLAQLFSGNIAREDTKTPPWNLLASTLQNKVGVAPTADPFHWSAVFSPLQQASRNRLTQHSVGCLALECMNVKDKNTAWLLTCMSELLNDYQERVQQVESYVYMECVGIQLERHFSEKRAAALASFEKKTDITTAINVANKKKLPKLVDELQRKLDEIGNEVTQTTVREAKELHLESKQLKSDIHDLAVRRLVRARETSTERAVALMALWAKEEENSAAAELKAMGEAIAALEKQMGEEDLDALVQGGAEI